MIKDILILGSTGFIGFNLIKKTSLIKNYQITAAYSGFNKDTNPFLEYSNVKVVKIDYSDLAQLSKLVESADAIINCVGLSSSALCDQYRELAIRLNLDIVKNLILLMKHHPNKKLIHLSSSVVYDDNVNEYLHENSRLHETNFYSKTKILAESELTNSHYNGNIIILRLFNVYGFGQSATNVISTILSQAISSDIVSLKKPNYMRDFIYIDDVIEAIIISLNYNKVDSCPQIFNICSGEPRSILSILNLVAYYLQKKITLLAEDAESTSILYGLNSRAKEHLGWAPKSNFEESLFLVINQFKGSKCLF